LAKGPQVKQTEHVTPDEFLFEPPLASTEDGRSVLLREFQEEAEHQLDEVERIVEEEKAAIRQLRPSMEDDDCISSEAWRGWLHHTRRRDFAEEWLDTHQEAIISLLDTDATLLDASDPRFAALWARFARDKRANLLATWEALGALEGTSFESTSNASLSAAVPSHPAPTFFPAQQEHEST